METQVHSITWTDAMQALYTPTKQLKQKVLDTVLFDTLDPFRPKDWIYTNMHSCIELRNIRSLTLDDVIRGFLENLSRIKQIQSKKSIRPYLVTVILSESRRIMIDSLSLWNIQSNFPQGIQGIQLCDILKVIFHKLIFIYERSAEGLDMIYCRNNNTDRKTEGEI